jgi:hypothetical protein
VIRDGTTRLKPDGDFKVPTRDDDFGDDDDRPRRRRPRDDFDDDDRPSRKKSNNGLIIGILIGVFVLCCGGGGTAAYLVYVRAKNVVAQVQEGVQEGIESAQSQANLQKIGRGIHNYESTMGSLPADSRDNQRAKEPGAPAGKPLLSWRVHLLPYLGEDALYRQFKLDEPWDSLNNKPLIAKMPAIYGTPEANKRAGEGKTFYRGFTQRGSVFERFPEPNQKVTIAGIVDGTSNTIMVVEAGDGVEWTKPDDFEWGPGRPRPALGGISPKLPYLNVLMVDGTVHKLRRDVSDQTLLWLIDRQDGNVIFENWEHP